MACDKLFNNVALLMKWNFIDQTLEPGVPCIDNSKAQTIPVMGGSIDTTTKKFGTACLLMSVGGEQWSVPDTALRRCDTGDFAIEFWVRPTGIISVPNLLVKGASTNYPYGFSIVNNVLTAQGKKPDTTLAYQMSGPLVANQFNRVLLQRTGSTIILVIGSALIDQNTYSGTLFADTSTVRILAVVSTTFHIDELRITSGASRYLTFAEPTEEFGTECGDRDEFFEDVLALVESNDGGLTELSGNGVVLQRFASDPHSAIAYSRFKYGVSSYRNFHSGVDGLNYLTLTDTSNRNRFTFEGEFTFEMWLRTSPGGSPLTICTNQIAPGLVGYFLLQINVGGATASCVYTFSCVTPSGTFSFATPTITITDAFHLISISRDASNVVRIALDGVVRASSTIPGRIGPLNPSGGAVFQLFGGIPFVSADLGTYFDQIRVSQTARFEGDYTPPTGPYGGSTANERIELSWTTPPSSQPIDEYRLYRSVDAAPFTLFATIDFNDGEEYIDFDVNGDEHSYSYYVFAVGSNGTLSPVSNTVTPVDPT